MTAVQPSSLEDAFRPRIPTSVPPIATLKHQPTALCILSLQRWHASIRSKNVEQC